MWGFFHDLWDSIKKSATSYKSGKMWKRLLQCASVASIHHGPFRSGAWGKGKQVAHREWIRSITVEDEDFRVVARKQAALSGKLSLIRKSTVVCFKLRVVFGRATRAAQCRNPIGGCRSKRLRAITEKRCTFCGKFFNA